MHRLDQRVRRPLGSQKPVAGRSRLPAPRLRLHESALAARSRGGLLRGLIRSRLPGANTRDFLSPEETSNFNSAQVDTFAKHSFRTLIPELLPYVYPYLS